MGKLVSDLYQIYIGNMKLHVNVPRYRRHEVVPRRVGSENKGKYMENPRKVKVVVPAIQHQKRVKEVWRVKTERKTFADVVKDDSQRWWKGPIIKTEQKVLPWMGSNVIGQFRDELNFEQLGDEFVKGGMSMIRVRYMGDNLALLTPWEGESMQELINLNNEWFEGVFHSIKP